MNLTVKNFNNQRGFTMMEIIAVLVIIAVISAVAVTRVLSVPQSTLKVNAE